MAMISMKIGGPFPRQRHHFLALTIVSLIAGGCGHSTTQQVTQPSTVSEVHIDSTPAVLIGAGDIADCGTHLTPAQYMAQNTARILDAVDGTVFTVGDNVYEEGTRAQFRDCYDLHWGRHKGRTRPTPGNHDYYTENGAPYFEYFRANAGEPGRGFYTYDAGPWRVFALNSNIPASPGSAQYSWLEEQLTRTSGRCVLAYWHHPVFNSGYDLNVNAMRDTWRLLYRFKADVVIAGHAHNYERFAKMDGEGRADPVNGIRQFIVGTGGAGFTPRWGTQPNSEVWNNDSYGVLKFTLKINSFDWEFIPVNGNSFRDSGTAECSR
jgi:acid phosphatase type 7